MVSHFFESIKYYYLEVLVFILPYRVTRPAEVIKFFTNRKKVKTAFPAVFPRSYQQHIIGKQQLETNLLSTSKHYTFVFVMETIFLLPLVYAVTVFATGNRSKS